MHPSTTNENRSARDEVELSAAVYSAITMMASRTAAFAATVDRNSRAAAGHKNIEKCAIAHGEITARFSLLTLCHSRILATRW